MTLARAIHQLFNTENKADRDAIQSQLQAICKFIPRFFNFDFVLAEQDDLKHGQDLVNLLTDSVSQEIKDIKMSLSVYCKQFYRVVSTAGYNKIDIPKTLSHIELLFQCFESSAIELKQKYSIFGALEQMILLYKYQENPGPTFFTNIQSILSKIELLASQGQESLSSDTLKSSFMLTEVMFSIGNDEVQKKILDTCISKLYTVVDQ